MATTFCYSALLLCFVWRGPVDLAVSQASTNHAKSSGATHKKYVKMSGGSGHALTMRPFVQPTEVTDRAVMPYQVKLSSSHLGWYHRVWARKKMCVV